ncbi:hypothetical protein Acr_07g0017440 [Actinidia rufa]|uniref:Cysteine proteinases superfamily protein n=1 Tax=Actinidia rufa TaxID=165716 RepID=A0A7J0EYR3_9ERIC|nr:hypothetical protein Acr_07g0017440 [Actinidia rufa]
MDLGSGIPGDGRCLFRSVAHGACMRAGRPSPSESLQKELADELRAKVADEFIKRRTETEWFVEGDFDTYVMQMRQPHIWGGCWKTLHALARATNTICALDLRPARSHALPRASHMPDLAVTSALRSCDVSPSLCDVIPVTSSLASCDISPSTVTSAHSAISELLFEETRLGLVSTSPVDTALATPGSRGRGSSGGSRGFSASGSQSSGGSASQPNECTFCHATDHRLLTCPVQVCKHYRQRGPSHYRSDCPNNPTRRDTRPHSTTATTGVSFTASASHALIDVSDLPALVQQILSASGNPSTALSASTGSADGYPLLPLLPTLTDPSIELFPKDVDVPADLPDDTLHVVPPTIVYPVESSSTDPAPPAPPLVHLPSDLPVRRSTRQAMTEELQALDRTIPITVYMWDTRSSCLKIIAEYGQQYGKENPIRVLYHGYGHYDALQSTSVAPQSKCPPDIYLSSLSFNVNELIEKGKRKSNCKDQIPEPVSDPFMDLMLSSGNPCPDFFFHVVVPDTPPDQATQRLQLAWDENPLPALKLPCHLRAQLGGYSSGTCVQTPEYEGIEDAHYAYRVRDQLLKEVLVPSEKTTNVLFFKHDKERFKECLGNVKKGTTKIASGALLPHEIIASLEDGESGTVAELQWQRIVDDLVKIGKLKNCLAICDVSGSMYVCCSRATGFRTKKRAMERQAHHF